MRQVDGHCKPYISLSMELKPLFSKAHTVGMLKLAAICQASPSAAIEIYFRHPTLNLDLATSNRAEPLPDSGYPG